MPVVTIRQLLTDQLLLSLTDAVAHYHRRAAGDRPER